MRTSETSLATQQRPMSGRECHTYPPTRISGDALAVSSHVSWPHECVVMRTCLYALFDITLFPQISEHARLAHTGVRTCACIGLSVTDHICLFLWCRMQTRTTVITHRYDEHGHLILTNQRCYQTQQLQILKGLRVQEFKKDILKR